MLTPQQIERLLDEGVNATAFAGSGDVTVSAPKTEATVRATTDREPSLLVISELSITLPRLPSGDFWRFGHYAEIYNNTDTIIHLDRKLLVRGFEFGHRDANETFNCESMRPWREDPAGIWTQRFVYAFPGSGAEFPLGPGAAVVIAIDAIDHAQVHPGLPDLSSADFEFVGTEDTDNPDVPNMVRLGRTFPGGHGPTFDPTDPVLVIAEPVDISSLAREEVPGVGDPEHWRIPADRILDVASLGPTPAVERRTEESGLGSFCGQFTHEVFARGWAPIVDSSVLDGSQRPVIAVRDGRKILQRTKVMELDFSSGPMTPGFIPDE